MQPFHRRAILFIDTLNDTTGVVQRIQELGLRPFVIHDVSEVADKERCPHIDTIVVDSLSMTESIREYEHLHYIPIVLLARLNPQDLASALISALEPNTVSPASAPNDVVFDILLAEDNMVNQKIAVKILENYGHTVEIAENGSLAVEAFQTRVQANKPFDIILMDVSMPFMGGMEATELIRMYEMNKGLLRTPIIALTAHAMVGDRERCLQAGMDDHITKPLRRGDLLNLINKLAGERAQLAVRHHLHQATRALMDHD
ncbi:CheY-like superfamily [Suillus americanus]|nr:CheY-like superfamily [Suillus americanus]